MNTKAVTESTLRAEADARVRSLEEQISKRDVRIEAMTKRLGDAELMSAEVLGAIHALPRPAAAKPFRKDLLTGGTGHDAILCLSDWHAEESVVSEETEGYAEYNWDIFKNRLWRVAEQTIKRVREKRSTYQVEKLHVAMLGDMLTGEIHDDLARTNTMALPEAMVRVGFLTAQMLDKLATEFDAVDVHAVVGNHGRMDKKPPAKQKAQRNYDRGVYMIAQKLTSSNPRITWDAPNSPSTVFEVAGAKVLIKHGDSINMHNRTPYYGIVTDMAAEQAKRRGRGGFDYMLIGHFHHLSVVDERTIIVPSLMGTNQYSFQGLHSHADPAQLLIFSAEGYPFLDIRKIYLNSADSNGFEDAR